MPSLSKHDAVLSPNILQCGERTCRIHPFTKYVVYLGAQGEGVPYHPANATWPSLDSMRTMPFDYTVHDPKYDDISTVYCPGFKPTAEGKRSQTHNCF